MRYSPVISAGFFSNDTYFRAFQYARIVVNVNIITGEWSSSVLIDFRQHCLSSVID